VKALRLSVGLSAEEDLQIIGVRTVALRQRQRALQAASGAASAPKPSTSKVEVDFLVGLEDPSRASSVSSTLSHLADDTTSANPNSPGSQLKESFLVSFQSALAATGSSLPPSLAVVFTAPVTKRRGDPIGREQGSAPIVFQQPGGKPVTKAGSDSMFLIMCVFGVLFVFSVPTAIFVVQQNKLKLKEGSSGSRSIGSGSLSGSKSMGAAGVKEKMGAMAIKVAPAKGDMSSSRRGASSGSGGNAYASKVAALGPVLGDDDVESWGRAEYREEEDPGWGTW
jgi:hypothetical protein